MRRIFFIALLLLITEADGQELKGTSLKNPETDFSRYMTYQWSGQVDDGQDPGNFFLNDLFLKSDLRAAVRDELDERGYRKRQYGADLIVNFRVFEKPAKLRGYQGYGSSYWGIDEHSAAVDNRVGHVEAGTLIISILDRENSVLVYEGKVSGLINEDGTFNNDEGMIRDAVRIIFEDYGVRVSEYTRR